MSGSWPNHKRRNGDILNNCLLAPREAAKPQGLAAEPQVISDK
jgi:hypothetical protein